MNTQSLHKAQIPNPALRQFGKLVGDWKTASTHPTFPGETINGKSSFDWIEGGAFLIWHSETEHKDFPDGIAIFGSDDAIGEFYMLYFDERKVSRKYNISIDDSSLKWWRDAPGFSQRYTWTFTDNDNTLIGKGELCEDGTTWKEDLGQTFTRIR